MTVEHLRTAAETRAAVLRAVDEGLDDTVALLRELVDTPSVGPWFGEDGSVSGEGAVQGVVRRHLEALGAEIDAWEPSAASLAHHAGEPGYFADRDFTGRPNVVGRLRAVAGQDSPALMFLGHVDVVPAGEAWTVCEPFASVVRDGRVHGRGTCDMKGGIAAALAAVRAVRAVGAPLTGDVLVATVTEEETGGMGTLALVDRGYRPELGVVIPEPTSLQVAPLCRGILWGEITVPGRSGHIEIEQPHWSTGGAVDAIALGRDLLRRIDETNARWAGLPEKNHRYLPLPCEISVAEIRAGTYPSSWAGSFTLRFDVQYLPAELDELGGGGLVRAQVEQLVREFAAAHDWLREHPPVVTWLVDADCGETPDTEPVVTAPVAALREIGREPVVQGVTSHTDMGRPIRAGVPAITFGPGSLTIAHQPDEYVPVDELHAAARVMALTILDLCGAP